MSVIGLVLVGCLIRGLWATAVDAVDLAAALVRIVHGFTHLCRQIDADLE